MRTKPLPESILTVTLAYLPIGLYWCLKEFVFPRPYWIFYDHTETLYYYASIELAEGLVPSNLDNPGTPVQWLGVLLIKLVGSDPGSFPLFQKIAHGVILVLSFFASVLIVRFTLGGVNRWMSVASVWFYYIFSVALLYFQVWSPESFYYVIGSLSICCLFWLLDSGNSLSGLKVLLFGISIGLLVSVKFIFLAWIPAMCLVVLLVGISNGWVMAARNVIVGIGGVVAGFAIVTFPLREGYAYMIGWIWQNASRDGAYGTGALSQPSLGDAVANWSGFFASSKTWTLLFLVLLLAGFVKTYRNRQSEPDLYRQWLLVSTFVLTGLACSLLFVMRSYASRYMLPVGLGGVMIYLVFIRSFGRNHTADVPVGMATCVILGLVLVKSMVTDFRLHSEKTRSGIEVNHSVTGKINRLINDGDQVNPVIIYGWRVPMPSFAMRQMAYREHLQQRVDKIFPLEGHHLPWPEKQTFRIPGGGSKWDFAVIDRAYLDGLSIGSYSVEGEVGNFKILRSVGAN